MEVVGMVVVDMEPERHTVVTLVVWVQDAASNASTMMTVDAAAMVAPP